MLTTITDFTIQLLLLAFLLITFLQSGLDKILDRKGNVAFLQTHFKGTFLAKNISFFVSFLAVLEIIISVLILVGIVEIFLYQTTFYGFLAAGLSAKVLLMLLFGQRIAKDYEGARTITVYFIATIMALYFLKP
jgi:hypothetical protein